MDGDLDIKKDIYLCERLTKSQLVALEYIKKYARSRKFKAKQSIDQVLQMSNIAPKTFEDAVAKVKTHAKVGLHFHPDGPAPRFGSCYFLLYPKVSYRCTYTYLDSHQDPKGKGTYEELDDILAALMTEAFLRDSAIGEKNLTLLKILNHLLINLEKPFSDPSNKEPNRNLNHYIEAQVHGDVSLKEDVEVLVADPSFKGTRIGRILEQICKEYSIALYWHMGFALLVDEVPMDFRGPSMISLAKRIARHGYIDANMIGVAAMDLKRNPSSWNDRGTYDEVLQELKLLWHVLVRCGKPLQNFLR